MRMDWRQVNAALERQGFRIEPTKHGFRILAPNGFIDQVHRKPTDASLRKTVSRLKNRGEFKWPE